MKNKTIGAMRRFLPVAVVGGLAASSTAAKADIISDGVALVTSYSTTLGTGALALLAIPAIFVGVKLVKRLMGKA